MPRISERKALIHELEECLQVLVAYRSLDSVKRTKDDADIEEILELIYIARGYRYLDARTYVVNKHGLADQLFGDILNTTVSTGGLHESAIISKDCPHS